MVLQVGVDAGDGNPDAAVGVTNLVTKNLGGVNNERHDRKGDQGQFAVHVQHDGDDSGEDKYILEDRDHSGGEHFVQGVDVGGDARDQASHGILVIEADVEALQVAKDLAAQVEHDFLSGPLHEVGLQVFEQKAEEREADVEGGDLRDADQRFAAEKSIKRRVQAFDWGQVSVDDEAREVR